MSEISSTVRQEIKKSMVQLCFSENRIIHILHHAQERSLCGSIENLQTCVATKNLFIKDLLDYMLYRIDNVRSSSNITRVWNHIDISKENDGLPNIFEGIGKDVYDSEDFVWQHEEIEPSDMRKMLDARFCHSCLGIFMGALFAPSKARYLDQLIEKYLEKS